MSTSNKAVRKCMLTSINRLEKLIIKPKTADKKAKYNKFMDEEGENLAFLLSRVVCLVRSRSNPAKAFLAEFLRSEYVVEILNHQEPGLILAKKVDNPDVKKNDPVLRGYEDYPSGLDNDDMAIVTRVMVAQFLAVWSFNYRTKMKEILDTCIKKVRQDDDITALKFTTNQILTPRSSENVYFVCHIVLLATRWGHRACLPEYFKILHPIVLNFFTKIQEEQKENVFSESNVEVFVEILFCLLCLGDKQSVAGLVGDCVLACKNTKKLLKKSTYHRRYHTYILWALFFGKLVRNELKEKKKEKRKGKRGGEEGQKPRPLLLY